MPAGSAEQEADMADSGTADSLSPASRNRTLSAQPGFSGILYLRKQWRHADQPVCRHAQDNRHYQYAERHIGSIFIMKRDFCAAPGYGSGAVKIACFSLMNSLRFAMDSGINVDSPIMHITIMRPRISACFLENPASENIQTAKEKRFFKTRLNTRLALVSDWAHCQIGRS